jgi:hypothetical protein
LGVLRKTNRLQPLASILHETLIILNEPKDEI